MTAIATIEPTYGSAEWVAERRNYIGASDVPAILGLSPYASAYDVWLQKKGLAKVEDAPHLRWGHYHEAGLAAEYQRALPTVKLEEARTVAHPKYPWLRATLDRLALPRRGDLYPVEFKSTSEYLGHLWGEPFSDQVPAHVTVQMHVQFIVRAFRFGHAAVLVGHSDCRLPYPVEYDAEIADMVNDGVHEFHRRYILGDEEPPIDGPNAEAHLRKKYATHSDVVIKLEGAQAELLATFLETYSQRKALEKAEEELKPKLMDLIGQNYGIKCDAGKVIWYSVKGRSSVDAKGLIARLNVPEDVVAEFTKVGAASRTFRPMPVGD